MTPSDSRSEVLKCGSFYRKSDGVVVQRFKCLPCKRTFSEATQEKEFRQNKRQINPFLNELLCSGVSQRRCARILKVNIKTIARKLKFLGAEAHQALTFINQFYPQCVEIEFDDLETIEHTKCKPLSVTMAVEYKTRRILGFEVSRMPAKGHLAAISRKKYGFRKDERPQARKKLFERINVFVNEKALIKSDQHPGYPIDVKRHFPGCRHKTYKSRKACIAGQGELKEGKYDPLFSLNHSFAMLRANINRLFRRTWNTTKDPLRLADHIAIYALYHNAHLIK